MGNPLTHAARTPATRGGSLGALAMIAGALVSVISDAYLPSGSAALAADAVPAATQPSWPPPLSSLRPDDFEVKTTDYVIGRNDLLKVSITGLQEPDTETVKNLRVNAQGAISLGGTGVVIAAGRTPQQLTKDIGALMKENHGIEDATVTVDVIEARQRTFSILGSVSRPGQYAIMTPDMRLRDALSLAGRPTAEAEAAYVVRGNPAPAASPSATTQATKRTLRIPLQQLASRPDAWNIVIRSGDLIVVPSAEEPKR